MKDGGYLTLGKSETPTPLNEYFSVHDKKHKVYRRQGERFLMPPVNSSDPTPLPKARSVTGAHAQSGFKTLRDQTRERRERHETNSSRDEFLLRFPAGVVVVDRKYDVRSINAPARRLLSISEPAVGDDLLHLIRGAHYAELRAAMDTAFREGQSATVTGFAVEEITTGDMRYLHVTCYPLREDGGESPVESVLILVEDVTDLWRSQRELEERIGTTDAELEQVRREAQGESARQKALNQRLIEANQQLTEANQELTSINEELQSTNEQHVVTGEETQAATEEVETLNEELQATNEELETLNEELQATIEELNTTNEDLQARSTELQDFARTSEEEQASIRSLLESLPDAVLAVDTNGQVLFANGVFQQTFGAAQEGESSLQNFVPRDANGESLPLEELPQRRTARGESFRMEICAATSTTDEHRFEVIGRPLRNGVRHGGIMLIREIEQ